MLHLLTGRPPREFMSAEGHIVLPPSLPGTPRLTEIRARMLRVSPNERFPSVRAVRAALLANTHAVAVAGATSSAIAGSQHVMAVAQGAVPTGPETPPNTLSTTLPRVIEESTRRQMERVAPSMWLYMDSAAKPGDSPSIGNYMAFAFSSVVTAGILPLVFYSTARARKKRVARFFANGIETAARILELGQDQLAFGEKIAVVAYEYRTADGEMRRDHDRVLRQIANRWQRSDVIRILYIPEEDDSVVISTR